MIGLSSSALPYATNALEPYINGEDGLLKLFSHHENAVKGADMGQQVIEEVLDENDSAMTDYRVKRSAQHFSNYVLHSIYWTNVTNKKQNLQENYFRKKKSTLTQHFKA